jgi:hydrogenase nickel incorporation protein HypA/HybF
MHEESLVRSLLQQVDRLVEKNAGIAASLIEVEVGAMSGVEPMLISSAFERLVGQSGSPAARLKVTCSPLAARCEDCDAEFEIMDFQFVCPQCAKRRLKVTRGDSVRLLSVVLELSESAGAGVN